MFLITQRLALHSMAERVFFVLDTDDVRILATFLLALLGCGTTMIAIGREAASFHGGCLSGPIFLPAFSPVTGVFSLKHGLQPKDRAGFRQRL